MHDENFEIAMNFGLLEMSNNFENANKIQIIPLFVHRSEANANLCTLIEYVACVFVKLVHVYA